MVGRDTSKLAITSKLRFRLPSPTTRRSRFSSSEEIPRIGATDFSGDEETILSSTYDRPVMVHRYPAAMKAFYMQPDPARPDLALGFDMLAPEGYGEIIGGGERVADYDLLLKRLRENNLPEEAFGWYLDLRRYGSVPHAGFGLGTGTYRGVV